MRAWIEDDILYLHSEDVPPYKKRGSIVRNSYFWALRSIAARASFGKAWEFETAVWFALQRMLTSFMDSGYLATGETQLEFCQDAVIPAVLQPMATWIDAELFMAEAESETQSPFGSDLSEEQRSLEDELTLDDNGPDDGSAESSAAQGWTQRSRWGQRSKKAPKAAPNSALGDSPEDSPRDRPLPPYSSYR